MPQDNTTTEGDAVKAIGRYRRIILDALTTAIHASSTASEAFEGTPDIFIFDDVRKAISTFISDDPAMMKMGHASVRNRL